MEHSLNYRRGDSLHKRIPHLQHNLHAPDTPIHTGTGSLSSNNDYAFSQLLQQVLMI